MHAQIVTFRARGYTSTAFQKEILSKTDDVKQEKLYCVYQLLSNLLKL